jgi:hypothetical protein
MAFPPAPTPRLRAMRAYPQLLRLAFATLLLLAGAAAHATDATVTITDLNQVYNGQPKAVAVTTDPVGLSVLVTYNGSNTVPSQVGTYSVVATVTATNYRGSATATEVISSSSSTTTATTGTATTSTATTSTSSSGTTTASDASSSSSSPCGFGAGAGGALGLLLMLVASRPRRR